MSDARRDSDVYAPASEYYRRSPAHHTPAVARSRSRTNRRTYPTNAPHGDAAPAPLPQEADGPSDIVPGPRQHRPKDKNPILRRRGSFDARTPTPRCFLVDVDVVEKVILDQEDTNGNCQITVEDNGPKVLRLPTANSGGYRTFDVRGSYVLANLLQEITLAREQGKTQVVIDEERLYENPVNRLSRMIRDSFWNGLIRCMDEQGMKKICEDSKNANASAGGIVYVPHGDDPAWEYYTRMARDLPDLKLQVVRLPKDITPEYVNSINDKAGILTLAANVSYDASGRLNYQPLQFVVPGGRFNEQYGWDSHFESAGLVLDGRWQLAKNMVDNFVYEIKHYGKILNANRSYYLTRSQPPFLTEMASMVYNHMPATTEHEAAANRDWLRTVFDAAIVEYLDVWTAAPRYNAATGLSCYRTTGIGMPPETESTHFDTTLTPYAKRLGVSLAEYKDLYNSGQIYEPALDEYFVHDRALRESGHDTSYRLEHRCANLATIDLNSLLYKYEVDIANTLDRHFGGRHTMLDGRGETTSVEWRARAEARRARIDKYLWNEDKGMYFDYDVALGEQSLYESATTFWALWAGCASPEQARRLVEVGCSKLEVAGGLVGGTEESRGLISKDRPNRQWDYPYGWAPHQMMAWQGLCNYGYGEVAQRLAYRWLYTMTKAFVDYNGMVVEKLNVVDMSHKVVAEYGNVGSDFRGVPREGFGWMNASFQVGLSLLGSHMRRALGALTEPDKFFQRANWRIDGTASHSPAETPWPMTEFARELDTRRYQKQNIELSRALRLIADSELNEGSSAASEEFAVPEALAPRP
ncbi:alpha,alpha-trehalase nth1 [Coemansia javaensis]|uniref:Trehalase n=1 Tax=Coemansia javaensis TaxID=2761396 RepID=A0A9W8HLR9_9FUNG|nr:alpha,alpha-trehalase nth1 [Coemansia javaensis]